MKTIKLVLVCIFCLAFTVNTNAQFLEKLAKKAAKNKPVEQTVEDKKVEEKK